MAANKAIVLFTVFCAFYIYHVTAWGYRPSPLNIKPPGEPHVADPRVRLPDQVDWRNVNGTNYCQQIRNQHLPVYCGGCWAFAPTRAITDAFRIAHGQKGLQSWHDIMLAPQVPINCCSGSCAFGGDATEVLDYARKQGMVDETCQPFTATDLEGQCGDEDICKYCERVESIKCGAVESGAYKKYYVDSWGPVSGEENMKSALTKGPIVCNIADTTDLKHLKQSSCVNDVFEDKTGRKIISHVISLVGYGTSPNGTKYWIVANSWGTAWGCEKTGYANLIRGIDNLAVEDTCYWLTVKA